MLCQLTTWDRFYDLVGLASKDGLLLVLRHGKRCQSTWMRGSCNCKVSMECSSYVLFDIALFGSSGNLIIYSVLSMIAELFDLLVHDSFSMSLVRKTEQKTEVLDRLQRLWFAWVEKASHEWIRRTEEIILYGSTATEPFQVALTNMKSTKVMLMPCIGWNRSLLMVRKAQRGYWRMIQT